MVNLLYHATVFENFQDPSLENAINEGTKLNHVKTQVKNNLPTQADIAAEKDAADHDASGEV